MSSRGTSSGLISNTLAVQTTARETSNDFTELQILSGIDQLLLSPSSSSNNNQNTRSLSSMVKIIDIQKSKRKCPTSYEHSPSQQHQQQQQPQESWSQQGPNTSQDQSKWTATASQQQFNAKNNNHSGNNHQQQHQQSSSSNQKQSSGEILSSFESDYDLLVYLGETETEDIVDTERSLDYQDQTWRQSICGGASLAPTIDDSLDGALLSGTSPASNCHSRRDADDFDLLNSPTPTAATFSSGSPFFTPPTVASSIGGRQTTNISSSLSAPYTRVVATTSRSSTLPSPAARLEETSGTSSNLRRAEELNVESDDCDNEVSLVFQRQQLGEEKNNTRQVKPVTRIVQHKIFEKTTLTSRVDAADNRLRISTGGRAPGSNQPQQKSNTNIGNKLGSLFSRKLEKSQQNDGEVQMPTAELSTMGRPATTGLNSRHTDTSRIVDMSNYPQRKEQAMSENSTGAGRPVVSDDAAELDRLLAEMNESLDLKSLARYDPMAGKYPAVTRFEQRQQHQIRSQTLNPRNNGGQPQARHATQEPVHHLRTSNDTSHSSRSLSLASVKLSGINPDEEISNTNSQQQQQSQRSNLAAESESSILDEYDGASRMLEQMISDQLLDRSHKIGEAKHQQQYNQVGQLQPKSSANQAIVAHEPGRSATIDLSKSSSAAVSVADNSPGGRDIPARSMDNESPTKTTTASSTRKVSTCSSSVATETSVVLANPPLGVNQTMIKTAAANNDEPSFNKDLEQQVILQQVRPGGGSNRRSLAKQSTSFDQGSPSDLRSNRVQSNSKQPPVTSHSLDLVDPANPRNSSTDDRPPTPPAVDYNDDSIIIMHEVDHEGGKVIRLEATEFPLDETGSDTDEFPKSKPTNETPMDKMKRRTLSSMRSMRNKFHDFITVNKSSHHVDGQANQQSNKLPTDGNYRSQQQQNKKAPQPPKRSSSIGSQYSNNNQSRNTSQNRRSRLDNHGAVKETTTRKQERESRSRAPREKPQKQSFGQQIRERLSRSKSRFSKFLKPAAARAQSSPNMKETNGLRVDDGELFQPSDIARNSEDPLRESAVKQRDSFDESLDRHLAASLEVTNKQKNQSKSSSSSSSELSGLDLTKTKSRSRPKSRKKRDGVGNHSDHEMSKEKRPSSLISLRRLGSLRSKKQTPPTTEDFDSLQVKTSSEIPTAANRKRSRKNRKSQTKSPSEAITNSSGGESGVSPLNSQKQLTKTGDYFGKEAPLKADSDDKLSNKTPENLTTNKQNPINMQCNTNLQLPEISRGKSKSPVDNRSAKSWVCENQFETSIKDAGQPNRSQSMKSVSEEKNKPATASDTRPKLESGDRTVSFSNLQNQQRRPPSSLNTFRPASACAQLEPVVQDNQDKMNENRADAVVTPVGLSSDPLVGRRLESTKPAQLDHHQSRLTPIRAKGAAMIDDIKHKCSELFSPADHSADQQSRGRRSRDTTASVPPSHPDQVRVSPSRSPQPPVRPPRKRGLHKRSKSVSARPVISVEDLDSDEHEFHVVELRPATPGSSLNREKVVPTKLSERSHQQQARQSPVGEKWASFAQSLKHSAVDFFQQQGTKPQPGFGNKSTSKGPLRAPDETIVPTGDLLEWKPVITTTTTTATVSSGRPISGRSFRVFGAKDELNDEQKAMRLVDDRGLKVCVRDGSTTLKHQHSSPDSDSTWESTGDDDDAAQTQVQTHSIDIPHDSKIVNNQTKSVYLDDESSQPQPMPSSSSSRVNEPNSVVDEQRATSCRNGRTTTDSKEEQVVGSSSSDLLRSAAVDHKFDDKEQDRNNNTTNKAHKEFLQPSERYQQQRQRQWQLKAAQLAELKQERAVHNCDAVVSEDYSKIVHQPMKQPVESAVTKSATGSEIDEYCEHERNIDVDERSVHRQQQSSTKRDGTSSSSGDGTRIIVHSDSKPFKFNANLPSPSQLLQEKSFESDANAPLDKERRQTTFLASQNGEEVRDKMARVALRPQQKEEIQQQRQHNQQQQHSQCLNRLTEIGNTTTATQQEDQQRISSNHAAVDPENRLSVYENVRVSDQDDIVSRQNITATKPIAAVTNAPDTMTTTTTATATAQTPIKSRRQWRRPETPPHVPPKPAHLILSPSTSLIEFISERVQPPIRQPIDNKQLHRKSSSSSSSNDDWTTDDVVAPVEVASLRKGPEEEEGNKGKSEQQEEKVETARKSEQELVSMTSIIHDSIDDLMEARPSGRISSTIQSSNNNNCNNSRQQGRMSSASLQRRDSNFGTDNDWNVDSDDTDSSFAAAAASRQRLVRKFEQKAGSLPIPEPQGQAQTRVKFPAFTEGKSAAQFAGRGDSLVKRLARNFDQQTMQQQEPQQPADLSRRPPMVPTQKIAHTDRIETQIIKSFDEDSTTDWCDTKSTDFNVDENEVAEFLQDFDRKPTSATEQNQSSSSAAATASANSNTNQQQHKRPTTSNHTTVTLTEISAQEASEACSSVSTGADPYVTVAESTLGDDDNDDDDEDQLNGYAERQHAAPAMGTTSDDDTLNDDELRDEEDADNVLMENLAQSILDDEDDLTESYTSAHGTLPRAGHDGLAQRQPQPQPQQQAEKELPAHFLPIAACERDDNPSPPHSRVSAEANVVAVAADAGPGPDSDDDSSPAISNSSAHAVAGVDSPIVPNKSGKRIMFKVSSSSPSSASSSCSSSVSSETIPEIRLRKNLQKLYHVVNEICSSEAKFVDTLRLLNVDFRQHIMASPSNVIPQDRLGSMLKHLPQLQALNENLLDELEQARDQWPHTQKIAHVLVKIGPFLKHYSTYIREFESMQQQYNDNLKKYPQFAERVRDFEASDLCKKLTIQHHILKPIQRIPQYRLLLQQYLHNLKPDDVDYEDTVNALEVVSRVAEHADHSMSEGVNFAKLLALQTKIVGKQRDIVQPGRVFIKEGELMKVCRKQIQPRWFVLLNDALLYLAQVQSSDILFLKNELPLDGCLVSLADGTDEPRMPPPEPQSGDDRNQPSPLPPHQEQQQASERIGCESGAGGKQEQPSDREFNVSTRTRSFALIAKSKAERDEWVSVLRRTVEEYMAKRRSFISSIYRQQQQDTNQSSPTSSEAAAAAEAAASTNGQGPQFSSSLSSSSRQQQQQLENDNASRMIEEHQQQHHLLGQMAPIWTPDSRVSMCQLCTSSFSALFRRHHCRACGRVVCSACSSNKAPLIYLKCRAARVCDQCFDTLKANIHLYYLPPNAGGLNPPGSLSDRLTLGGGGLEPLIGEDELRRLDEHFRTLLKSQFTRSTSLSKLASGGGGGGGNSGGRSGKKSKKKATKSKHSSVCPLLAAVCPKHENISALTSSNANK